MALFSPTIGWPLREAALKELIDHCTTVDASVVVEDDSWSLFGARMKQFRSTVISLD
jgi:hypothetical protein